MDINKKMKTNPVKKINKNTKEYIEDKKLQGLYGWEFEPELKESKKILKQMEEFLINSVGKRCRSKAAGCYGCEMWLIYDLFKMKLS